ncbi:hypothetical protein SAMN05421823_101368 [Catalinimonas alkaloidigena]|uniref:Uncharacterized protein n=1 Tax=Catalinimonas alkaloidigena TaxID=1075417 RepID=A0A1G8XJ92_9BACT|nr:hypothetical protein [Catalinimonas alkaloidigena]SDJ89975.1 hypothetical protein SAMN05421823_101368 [Catalinimonas alkaloidigena]
MTTTFHKYTFGLLLVCLTLCSACQQDPFDGFVSRERAITQFVVGEAQIGAAEITRTLDSALVTVYVKPGTDLSNVTPFVMTSYQSTVTPASGEAVNFAANNHRVTYRVTAESGETRDWTVEVKEYQFDLEGTWQVIGFQFTYFIGEGEDWGWSGTKDLANNLPGAAAETDDRLSFALEGVREDGMLYGTYTHDPGADGVYGTFLFDDGTDYAYKFRKLPAGQGTFVRNLSNNTLTFQQSDGSNTQSMTLEWASAEKTQLQLPFAPGPYDIDWNGSGNKMELGAAKVFWYALKKVE